MSRKVLRLDPYSWTAVTIVVFYVLMALLQAFNLINADYLSESSAVLQAPSIEYWFGTDHFGRSVLAKTLHGMEISLTVALASCLISVPLALLLGLLSGFFQGLLDDIYLWFTSTFASVPSIILLISFSLLFGKGMLAICLALGLTGWVNLSRLVRAEVMKHRVQEYVESARCSGVSSIRILFRHILPNVVHIVTIKTSLLFVRAIKAEVILSFLGLGVQSGASWGTMINDAKIEIMQGVWWQLAAASLAMFGLLLSFNHLADVLRDKLDPRLKGIES